MLLRELVVNNHTIRLVQNENIYVAQLINKNGERIFYHEYNEYEKIRPFFDEIVQSIQQGDYDIESILAILKRSTI